jgi:hypothetical protein
MTDRHWSWAGACSIGTSHLRADTGCDDAAACIEVATCNGPALIAVVSDGAGSARLSHRGARLVTRSFCASATSFLIGGGRARDIDQDVTFDWLDDMRDLIEFWSGRLNESRREFASTLVGCVVQPNAAAVIHVGDGACAIRLTEEAEWRVPSWPAQGEYASTTYFVTDDPRPRAVVSRIEGCVAEVAVFTDGLERLALDFVDVRPFAPFFESMLAPLRGLPAGRQRRLSRDLRVFLDSPSVTERTDDDKTLLMARRTLCPCRRRTLESRAAYRRSARRPGAG